VKYSLPLVKDLLVDTILYSLNKMLLEGSIVGAVALVALITGLIANVQNYGWGIGAVYVCFIGVTYVLIVWQIWCVIYGTCVSTAWWNVFLAVITFGTLAYYYILNLHNGNAIVALSEQPVINANPLFSTMNAQLTKYGNVDILKYTENVPNKIINRPNWAGLSAIRDSLVGPIL
jgi:glucan phosphoethanolaminetransferase (alkaline phosphatase superfamily)